MSSVLAIKNPQVPHGRSISAFLWTPGDLVQDTLSSSLVMTPFSQVPFLFCFKTAAPQACPCSPTPHLSGLPGSLPTHQPDIWLTLRKDKRVWKLVYSI
jgi:hypothetical protein